MSDFKCKKCGKCCSNLLPLYEEDKIKIKKIGNLLKENKLLIDKEWYMRCPFLNYKNECDIYEDRPLICKSYTCNNFENHIFEREFLQNVMSKKFELVNMRKEFFGSKEE